MQTCTAVGMLNYLCLEPERGIKHFFFICTNQFVSTLMCGCVGWYLDGRGGTYHTNRKNKCSLQV